MPLSGKDKTEARDALALALSLNEPETMIEGLRLLCAKRLEAADLAPQERDRWQAAINALSSVAQELERANAPTARDTGRESAPSAPGAPGDTQSSDC